MKEWNWRDMGQNLLIVLLSISAVVLFTQTQLYSLGLHDRAALSGTAQPVADAAQAAVLTAPVRVAVTGTYGRYGNVTLTTGAEDFTDPLGRRLAEALGSAGDYLPCGREAFLEALEVPSLYYDFLEPLPLSVLALLAGGGEESGREDVSARYLVLAEQAGGSAALYLWDGEDVWMQAATAVSNDSLEQVIGRYELGGAALALDGGEESLEACLAPCSLLLEAIPALPVLSVEDPLTDTDWLLGVLGFNPRTRTRYLESNGTELITDGDRSLRIRPDGTVHYLSGSETTLTVDAAEETPTLREAVLGAGNLLNSVLTPVSGEAAFYLMDVRRGGSVVTLHFGYQVQGVPIQFAGGGYAAEVSLKGNTVSALTLRFRKYAATEESSLLLPLAQVLAVAARQEPGKELAVGYVDSGGSCAAHWLAD